MVNKSKALQKEIIEERAVTVGQTDKEFYRKNRYTTTVQYSTVQYYSHTYTCSGIKC